MRIQPRKNLLDLWRATVRSSYKDSQWVWGGREPANSVSDAEQLLCIILPATEISSFALDNPDQTDEDILAALRPLGNSTEIPRRLVGFLTEYFKRYSTEEGSPLFHGGGLFSTVDITQAPTDKQAELDVVESYSISITLTLATIYFARNLRKVVVRSEVQQEVAQLESLASRRLTAAMVGLLRSFTVNAFDVDSDAGRYLIQTINQGHYPARELAADLRDQLQDVTAALRDIVAVPTDVDLDSSDRLYECGWSWGVVQGAATIKAVDDQVIVQREGYAVAAPYLYFTVVALDGIADLYAQRTTQQGLLNELQNQLASSLRIRWEMTQLYWSTVAGFGKGRWPLEDVPWRTTDGVGSDYFTLLVTSIAARGLASRRGTDEDLRRLGEVLKGLADRARITRRTFPGDIGVDLHTPGVPVALEGSEVQGPLLAWKATDFSPLLLKRTIRIAELIKTDMLREEVKDLADLVWDHMLARRHHEERDNWFGIWDQPHNAFSSIAETFDRPSWHHTFRVVESLRYAALLIRGDPLSATALSAFASSLQAEAEHLLDQELLSGSTEAGTPLRGEIQSVRSNLERARGIITSRPGSAIALLLDALHRLGQLAAARQERTGF
jgi:hypothetical protein